MLEPGLKKYEYIILIEGYKGRHNQIILPQLNLLVLSWFHNFKDLLKLFCLIIHDQATIKA